MALEIRAMVAADYDEALSLWRQSEGIGLSGADSPEAIAAFLARNPGLSLVVRLGGRLVGAVLCGHDGRRGYLHHLAVALAHRGRGLGTKLVEACLAGLAAAGIEKCHIFLRADNRNGEAFWRNIGWTDRTDLKMMSRETGPSPRPAPPPGSSG
jgi:putative acetyltransferase